MHPLDGITVVAIEQAVAAPLATRQLADQGARVIKIERPGTGDFAREYDETIRGLGSAFAWLNRSKESLVLDLKHPAALDVMMRLLGRADVLVQNLAPGAAAGLGLGTEQLCQKFPRLIACDISGYGDRGPYRNKKAYDLLIQGEAGLIAITGTPEDPAKTGISSADIAAGMYAYSGILTALYHREKTGHGGHLKVSLFEALCEWMLWPLYYSHFGGKPFVRSGPNHAAICPYGPFRAGDGKTVIIGIQNEREWKRFCKTVLNRPELPGDPRFSSMSRRVVNREALTAMIEGSFSAMTANELTELLDRAEIANSNLNDLDAVWNHPQLAALDRWREVDSPAGRIPTLVPPALLDGCEPRLDPVPSLGQHSASILTELGFDQSQIERLKNEQVVS